MSRRIKSASLIMVCIIALNIVFAPHALCVSWDGDSDVDIYRKKENEFMKIALTFDDGPHPRYTPQILDILDKYGIKATFFAIGINADRYPDTMAMVIDRGHEIGNHTYTHPHVDRLDSEMLYKEVEKCEEKCEKVRKE